MKYSFSYSRLVGRLNILNLLASFPREIRFMKIRFICTWNTLHSLNSRVKYASFAHESRLIRALNSLHSRVKLASFAGEIWRQTSARQLQCCCKMAIYNHVTARASSWLVTAAQISAKVQIFQVACQTCQTCELRHSRRLIDANNAAGLSIASLHWLNM